MSGQTYTPGTYTGAATISIAGAGIYVTLDGEGDENAVFLFQASTTLNTAASTYFNLINGAKAENVLFAISTSATLGASSVLEDSLIVGTSVVVGIDAEVNGCIIAKISVAHSGRGGTTANSALTFGDSGTVLEHCVEVGSPTSSPSPLNHSTMTLRQQARTLRPQRISLTELSKKGSLVGQYPKMVAGLIGCSKG
jgi:hypothetical protein